MPIIEFLIISGFILYFVRMLIRLLLPMLFQGMVNKAQNQQTNHQHQYQQAKNTSDKVKVDYIPKTKSSIPDSEGDFIDYEEIK